MRQKYKNSLIEIEKRRQIKVQEQIRGKESARVEKLRQQEMYTQDIIYHGLWQSEFEVDNMILTYQKTSEKFNAMKAQLRFRNNVLQQVPEDKQYLKVEEQTENLKELVKQAVVKDDVITKHILVEKRVRHRFLEDDKDVWYTGKVISQ
ncbi:hypothetical protein MAR_038235, partial [Mya arenaria]